MSKFEHDVSREQKAILLWMPHMVGLAFMLQHKKAGAHREERAHSNALGRLRNRHERAEKRPT